jgi:hypothetical protein
LIDDQLASSTRERNTHHPLDARTFTVEITELLRIKTFRFPAGPGPRHYLRPGTMKSESTRTSKSRNLTVTATTIIDHTQSVFKNAR